MKKTLLLSLIMVLAITCKKSGDRTPLGPTDIRVSNITTVDMTDLTVNTFDSTYNYGSVKAKTVSGYHRFDRAYPKANIYAFINGQKYKTDTVFYTYFQYLGPVKATYEIYIENDVLKKLAVYVIMESDIK
jgi:hypothetical protein